MAGLLKEGVRVDAVVTDPPYHLAGRRRPAGRHPRFGKPGSAPATSAGKSGVYKRASAGFMGKEWDSDVAFEVEVWQRVRALSKPGGHVVAFGGTRTFHRLVTAIEDAGLEIRDLIAWLYGTGFPKSHNVGRGIDKANGGDPDGPLSAEAEAWEGWGTALKPAIEPICLARRPLAGTVAHTVKTYGTGALNVEACRVEGRVAVFDHLDTGSKRGYGGLKGSRSAGTAEGRWPANVVHDGSAEVLAGFPVEAGAQGDVKGTEPSRPGKNVYGEMSGRPAMAARGDGGSAARFFYSAKADDGDRLGSKHPTIKPVDLMRWLVRLVTPPGGTVLDPFAGTGTTGMACLREGFNAILIEQEAEYVADIRRRLGHVRGADTPLFRDQD